MITIIVYDESYECSKAVKGTDFVILYDESGNTIASFYGINSFDGYDINGGEWSLPEPTPEEKLRSDIDFISIMSGIDLEV